MVHYNVAESMSFNIDRGAQSLASYINVCTKKIKMGHKLLGGDGIHKLDKNHMYALDEMTARITGVKTVYEL